MKKAIVDRGRSSSWVFRWRHDRVLWPTNSCFQKPRIYRFHFSTMFKSWSFSSCWHYAFLFDPLSLPEGRCWGSTSRGFKFMGKSTLYVKLHVETTSSMVTALATISSSSPTVPCGAQFADTILIWVVILLLWSAVWRYTFVWIQKLIL